VHAYKNLFDKMDKDFDDSGNCNNDIECFSDNWDTQSDAVAMVLLSDGTEWCSGSLLNNTAQNFRPYFLTAHHCIDTDKSGSLSTSEIDNAENWMFKFQYKVTECGGSTIRRTYGYNGDQFRAAYNPTDFALVELDNSPLGNEEITWLGWDRTGNSSSEGTGIHHPSGDVMKISFDEDQLLETSYRSNSGQNYWRVIWDDGVTEGGSSGSPLFDQNGRVIGQLRGGYAECGGSDLRDWYGCFDTS
jgi:V8-like Glu-specific endopeptidase